MIAVQQACGALLAWRRHIACPRALTLPGYCCKIDPAKIAQQILHCSNMMPFSQAAVTVLPNACHSTCWHCKVSGGCCCAGRAPFKQALDTLLKWYKLTVSRSMADANASHHHSDQDMQLAIADSFSSAAKILSSAEEPVR